MSKEVLEHLVDKINQQHDLLLQHMSQEEKNRIEIYERLRNIENKLSGYRAIFRTLRYVAICVIGFFTIKFGDIKSLFN